MRNDYIVVTWPESQELFEIDGFREHAFLINDDKGMEIFGSSAYFVDKAWYLDLDAEC